MESAVIQLMSRRVSVRTAPDIYDILCTCYIITTYPAHPLFTLRFVAVNTPDGHLRSPMNGFVSVYVLDNNTRSEEMIVQTSIREIMDYDKLLSVHPDIIAVDYVSRILSDNDVYPNTDAKVGAKPWTEISFVAIGIAAAGFFFGLMSIWFLVKRQRKKSSQLKFVF